MNSKRNTTVATKLLLLLLLALFFSSCKKGGEPSRDDSEYIRLRLDVSQAQMRASSEASSDEKAIADLMVFFFDKTSGSIFKTPYLFDASTLSGKTMLIPLKPEEVNEKKVVVLANVKGKGDLEAKLAAVRNYTELAALYYPSATDTKQITAPGLLMQGEVVHTFTPTERVAKVALRRAVAKLTVKLYLKWEPLDARFPTTTQPAAFNLYQLRDVSRDTYLLERAPQLLEAGNRSERYHDNTAHAEYLWSFLPHAEKQGPLQFSAYINEYDQGDNAAHVPPYLYLKLHANIPASGSEDPEGSYPPPSGDDVIPAHEADFYYRLLLPRKVKRNSHYLVEAQILSAGSKDASKPLDVTSTITIHDWKVVEYDAKPEVIPDF